MCTIYDVRSRFDDKENVTGVNNVKSSVQKSIRHKLLDQMPHIETFMDDILPKKEALRIAKWYVIFFRYCSQDIAFYKLKCCSC